MTHMIKEIIPALLLSVLIVSPALIWTALIDRRIKKLEAEYEEALRRARLAEIRTDEMSKRLAGTPH